MSSITNPPPDYATPAAHYISSLRVFYNRWINGTNHPVDSHESLAEEFKTLQHTYYLDDVVADMKAEGYWDKTMDGLLK